MLEVILSREAREDVFKIWEFVGDDNSKAANRFLTEFKKLLSLLGIHPDIGQERLFADSRLYGMRSLIVPEFQNYLVFYRHMDNHVEIVRVLHGARDIEALFEE